MWRLSIKLSQNFINADSPDWDPELSSYSILGDSVLDCRVHIVCNVTITRGQIMIHVTILLGQMSLPRKWKMSMWCLTLLRMVPNHQMEISFICVIWYLILMWRFSPSGKVHHKGTHDQCTSYDDAWKHCVQWKPPNKEKKWTLRGPKFEKNCGQKATFVKAVYMLELHSEVI